MEFDFDFDIKSERPELGLHSIGKSWRKYQNEEEIWPVKDKKPNTTNLNDEENLSKFSLRDIRLFGINPIVEPYSSISYAVSLATAHNRDFENHVVKPEMNSSYRYTDKHHVSNSSAGRVDSSSFQHSKSRKRHADRISGYTASDVDPISSVSGSANMNSYHTDTNEMKRSGQPSICVSVPNTNISSEMSSSNSTLYNSNSKKRTSSSSSKRHITSSSSSSYSNSGSSRSSNKMVHRDDKSCSYNRIQQAKLSVLIKVSSIRSSGHSNVRSSGHSSSRSSGSSSRSSSHNSHSSSHNSHNSLSNSSSHSSGHNNHSSRKRIGDDSLLQLIADAMIPMENSSERNPSEPPGAAACRTRTELIALKVSTPDTLPDTIPTVADSPETAGSPTKPTDEPALPDDQSFSSPPVTIENLIPINMMNLEEIDFDEFNVDKLRTSYPNLIDMNDPPKDESIKQFVKYDPFETNTQLSENPYADTTQPKHQIVKFKFVPFTQVEPKLPESPKLIEPLKPSTSNVYLLELEEPPASPTPPPCGMYEIQSTEAYYRILPDPGIYERPTDPDQDACNAYMANWYFDENEFRWLKLKIKSPDPDTEQNQRDSDLDMDIKPDIDFGLQAPPTPQTPICMKRIRTKEDRALCNVFSGLLWTSRKRGMQDFSMVNQVPYLTNRFRQLLGRPKGKPGKIGNPIATNIIQDYYLDNSVKNYLLNVNKTARARNRPRPS